MFSKHSIILTTYQCGVEKIVFLILFINLISSVYKTDQNQALLRSARDIQSQSYNWLWMRIIGVNRIQFVSLLPRRWQFTSRVSNSWTDRRVLPTSDPAEKTHTRLTLVKLSVSWPTMPAQPVHPKLRAIRPLCRLRTGPTTGNCTGPVIEPVVHERYVGSQADCSLTEVCGVTGRL